MMRLPFTIEDMKTRGFTVINGADAMRDHVMVGEWDMNVDGLFLIRPSIEKCAWDFPAAEPFCNESELNWRSAVVGADFEPVSLGLPKFLNFGERGADHLDHNVAMAMADGSALLTAKLDGTLIVRSVWQDRVYFRTRNSFFLCAFEPLVKKVVEQKYPLLLDPSFCPEYHLHFEFISPRNLIIIRYKEDDLILLHAREGHRMAGWDKLNKIAHEGNLNLVPAMDMTGVKSPKALQAKISELEQQGVWDHEGIVIRDPVTGTMSKVKGDEYISRYRMKYHFFWDDFVQVCLEEKVTNLTAAKDAILARGVDWELLLDADNWWQVFKERQYCCEEALRWARNDVEDWLKAEPYPEDEREDRKQFAMHVKRDAPSKKAESLAFALYGGKDMDVVYAEMLRKELAKSVGAQSAKGNSFTLSEEE